MPFLKQVEEAQRERKRLRLEAVNLARVNGALRECRICCEEEILESDLIYCPMGHGVCKTCVGQ